MASFFEFSQLLDKAEGGYQNSPADKTGNSNSLDVLVGTNHGISAPVYEHFLGHPPTQAEMQQMTKEQALNIYQDKYWGMIQGDKIDHQQVANAIGDMAVNAEKSGIQLAHERLWLQGYPIDLPATNDRLSDQAVQAINGMNEREAALFVNAYTLDRANYYQSLGEKYDGNKVGWDNRLTNHFPEDKQVQGWHDAKQEGYYFTTGNIQHVIYSDEKGQVNQAKVDGVPGPGTQAAIKEWQAANNLTPTGYLDSPTNFVLNHQITGNDTTRQIGDTNKMLGEARDIRHEIKQEGKDWSTTHYIPTEAYKDSLQNASGKTYFQNDVSTNASPAPITFSNDRSAHFGDRSTPHFSNSGHSDSSSVTSGTRDHIDNTSASSGASAGASPSTGAGNSGAI